MQFLENEFLRVSINEFGAELTSIVRKSDQSEYVWNADPAFWGKHAPLLFPIIGRLKDQEYTLDGTTYEITRHGFARDKEFTVVQASDTCVELSLSADAYTKAMYPYDFTFTIRYSLDGKTLKKEHIVQNDSNHTMYYEIGGHDAYMLSFDDAALSDYYLEFEGIDVLDVIDCDADVMLMQSHHAVPLKDGRLYLSRETFSKDNTLMLERLPVHRCTLGCLSHSRKVIMEFPEIDYFAVWSPYKPDCDVPFICLEPWSTLPDCAYLGKELEKKVGIRTVAAGRSETLSFRVTIE